MFNLLFKSLPLRPRRAAVAVFVVVMIPVLVGFAALTVDVGYLYNVRAELQNAADAGAMAAATAMMNTEFGADPIGAARTAASDVVSRNLVFGRQLALDVSRDVVPGRANYDVNANRYNFTASNVLPDCVKVTVRQTEDSPNGAVPLFFAAIFGRTATNIQAEAVAAVAPRDIAIVADTSGSLRFDSQLKYYNTKDVNTYDVWNGLPGGALELNSTWQPGELPADLAQAAGPGWGYFKKLTYGNDVTSGAYDAAADPGMIQLAKKTNWGDANLRADLLTRGYSVAETNAILAQNGSNDANFSSRLAVALGFADWNSGLAGGKWSVANGALGSVGNGNADITSSELRWSETVLSSNLTQSASIWQSYISWGTSSSRGDFQNRWGLKTFVDYLVDQRYSASQTPELASAPMQPLQAIKDGVNLLTSMLTSVEAADQMSLETFSSTGIHQLDLSEDYAGVAARFNAVHPGGGTNIGAGMALAVAELTSPRARSTSRKVMVVLTDGYANYDQNGNYNAVGARTYVLDQAAIAASQGIEILSIAVGQDADNALMQEIATTGDGVYFHAAGTPAEYTAQLQEIFGVIGGRRAVELIQ